MSILKQINDAFKRWERTPKYQRVLILVLIALIFIGIPLFISVYAFNSGRELIHDSGAFHLTAEKAQEMHMAGVFGILLSMFFLILPLKLITAAIEHWHVIKNLINK